MSDFRLSLLFDRGGVHDKALNEYAIANLISKMGFDLLQDLVVGEGVELNEAGVCGSVGAAMVCLYYAHLLEHQANQNADHADHPRQNTCQTLWLQFSQQRGKDYEAYYVALQTYITFSPYKTPNEWVRNAGQFAEALFPEKVKGVAPYSPILTSQLIHDLSKRFTAIQSGRAVVNALPVKGEAPRQIKMQFHTGFEGLRAFVLRLLDVQCAAASADQSSYARMRENVTAAEAASSAGIGSRGLSPAKAQLGKGAKGFRQSKAQRVAGRLASTHQAAAEKATREELLAQSKERVVSPALKVPKGSILKPSSDLTRPRSITPRPPTPGRPSSVTWRDANGKKPLGRERRIRTEDEPAMAGVATYKDGAMVPATGSGSPVDSGPVAPQKSMNSPSLKVAGSKPARRRSMASVAALRTPPLSTSQIPTASLVAPKLRSVPTPVAPELPGASSPSLSRPITPGRISGAGVGAARKTLAAPRGMTPPRTRPADKPRSNASVSSDSDSSRSPSEQKRAHQLKVDANLARQLAMKQVKSPRRSVIPMGASASPYIDPAKSALKSLKLRHKLMKGLADELNLVVAGNGLKTKLDSVAVEHPALQKLLDLLKKHHAKKKPIQKFIRILVKLHLLAEHSVLLKAELVASASFTDLGRRTRWADIRQSLFSLQSLVLSDDLMAVIYASLEQLQKDMETLDSSADKPGLRYSRYVSPLLTGLKQFSDDFTALSEALRHLASLGPHKDPTLWCIESEVNLRGILASIADSLVKDNDRVYGSKGSYASDSVLFPSFQLKMANIGLELMLPVLKVEDSTRLSKNTPWAFEEYRLAALRLKVIADAVANDADPSKRFNQKHFKDTAKAILQYVTHRTAPILDCRIDSEEVGEDSDSYTLNGFVYPNRVEIFRSVLITANALDDLELCDDKMTKALTLKAVQVAAEKIKLLYLAADERTPAETESLADDTLPALYAKTIVMMDLLNARASKFQAGLGIARSEKDVVAIAWPDVFGDLQAQKLTLKARLERRLKATSTPVSEPKPHPAKAKASADNSKKRKPPKDKAKEITALENGAKKRKGPESFDDSEGGVVAPRPASTASTAVGSTSPAVVERADNLVQEFFRVYDVNAPLGVPTLEPSREYDNSRTLGTVFMQQRVLDYAVTRYRDTQVTPSEPKLTVCDVDADGNCLFRAVFELLLAHGVESLPVTRPDGRVENVKLLLADYRVVKSFAWEYYKANLSRFHGEGSAYHFDVEDSDPFIWEMNAVSAVNLHLYAEERHFTVILDALNAKGHTFNGVIINERGAVQQVPFDGVSRHLVVAQVNSNHFGYVMEGDNRSHLSAQPSQLSLDFLQNPDFYPTYAVEPDAQRVRVEPVIPAEKPKPSGGLAKGKGSTTRRVVVEDSDSSDTETDTGLPKAGKRRQVSAPAPNQEKVMIPPTANPFLLAFAESQAPRLNLAALNIWADCQPGGS